MMSDVDACWMRLLLLFDGSHVEQCQPQRHLQVLTVPMSLPMTSQILRCVALNLLIAHPKLDRASK